MKRIVVIGASSSSNSINRKLANYAAKSISLDTEIRDLNLNDFEMPIYSEDLQNSLGIPQKLFYFSCVAKTPFSPEMAFSLHGF